MPNIQLRGGSSNATGDDFLRSSAAYELGLDVNAFALRDGRHFAEARRRDLSHFLRNRKVGFDDAVGECRIFNCVEDRQMRLATISSAALPRTSLASTSTPSRFATAVISLRRVAAISAISCGTVKSVSTTP